MKCVHVVTRIGDNRALDADSSGLLLGRATPLAAILVAALAGWLSFGPARCYEALA